MAPVLVDQLSVWLVATFVAPFAGTGFEGEGGGFGAVVKLQVVEAVEPPAFFAATFQ